MSMKKESAVMDERTMIREQERLAREAKRKKTKKRKVCISIVVVVAVIVTIWYVGWGRNLLAQPVSTTVKIEKAVGQTVVYAKITEINGNEITYAIAEEVTETETRGEETQGEMPQGESMPGGGRGQGERPDMGNMPFGDGERPDMSNMPDMSEMGGSRGGGRGQGGMSFGGTTSNTATAMDQFTYDGTTYRIGRETVTAYIPVGTDVTTKLGTVTTFSRLAADDYVALVIEKDGGEEIIMAVYIVG